VVAKRTDSDSPQGLLSRGEQVSAWAYALLRRPDSAPNPWRAEKIMTKDEADFDKFMKTREEAAAAYVRGEIGPLDAISARVSPTTFFGPQGGDVQGAKEVSSRYAHDATSFEPGGESHLEVVHKGADGSVAYWTGFQHAKVRLRGKPDPISMKLRVTELFRREGNEWKLVHRHADSLSEVKS
jgi:ketosteroid isomerase-like protein